MAEKDYDEEAIWQRVNEKLDLKEFEAAKTEKARLKALKKAFRKDKTAKNILKMKRSNQRKIFEFATAQRALDDGKDIEKSLKKFKPEKRKRIGAFKGQLKKFKTTEILFAKAEAKGIKVRGIKEKPIGRGRPSKALTKLEGVTISKIYKFGNRKVRGIYKKGIRGVIRLETVK